MSPGRNSAESIAGDLTSLSLWEMSPGRNTWTVRALTPDSLSLWEMSPGRNCGDTVDGW